jgi:hypothetical protein
MTPKPLFEFWNSSRLLKPWLLGSVVVTVSVFQGLTAARADDPLSALMPLPGLAIRTNSAACISHFQAFHALASSVIVGVPSSGIQRLDFLSGGLTNSNGFSATGGSTRTKLYSTASTYSDGATFAGVQKVSYSGTDPFSPRIHEGILSKVGTHPGTIFSSEAMASGCAATTYGLLSLRFSKGSQDSASLSSPFAEIVFPVKESSSSAPGVCESPTQSLRDFASNALTVASQKAPYLAGNDQTPLTPPSSDSETAIDAWLSALPAGTYVSIYQHYGFSGNGWRVEFSGGNPVWLPSPTAEQFSKINARHYFLAKAGHEALIAMLTALTQGNTTFKNVPVSTLCSKL